MGIRAAYLALFVALAAASSSTIATRPPGVKPIPKRRLSVPTSARLPTGVQEGTRAADTAGLLRSEEKSTVNNKEESREDQKADQKAADQG